MEIIGGLFILIFGTLGHFIFEWSGHRKCAGIIFAVNESTWEHIKLTIYPAIIWMIVEMFVLGFSRNLVIATFLSMMAMIVLVPGLFYGYTAITHKNWLIPDILCFVVAVCIGSWIRHAVICSSIESKTSFIISIIGIITILALYFTCSYNPPHSFLFKDPVSGGYGPKGHDCDSHFHTL